MQRPNPCDYCALEHGLVYFPELSKHIDPDETYHYLSIVKKYLCNPAGQANMTCNPHTCQAGLKGCHNPRDLYIATRKLWDHYYTENFEKVPEGDAYKDILDELGF